MTHRQDGRRVRPARWVRSSVIVHVPFALVLVVGAVGLLRIVQYHWREGATLIGVALLVAAVLRAVLPARQIGLLAIRGRGADVLCYAALGLLVAAVAVTITGGPFG